MFPTWHSLQSLLYVGRVFACMSRQVGGEGAGVLCGGGGTHTESDSETDSFITYVIKGQKFT